MYFISTIFQIKRDDFMQFFIKYFAIVLSGIYIYHKLLNQPVHKKQLLISLSTLICLPIFAVILEYTFPYATILALILLSFFSFSHISNTTPEAALTATIISYGISYVLFTISVIIIGFTFNYYVFINTEYNHVLLQILVAVMQLMITPPLFLSKRLKKGMPFLTNKLYTTPFMIISIFLLFTALLISNNSYSNDWHIFPFLLIFLLAVFIYLSWKNNITRTYIERLREKDTAQLNASLSERESYIKALEEENRALSKIIHNDNKLIPAMMLAVKTFIRDSSSLVPSTEQTGNRLLKDLEQLSMHRKVILDRQDTRCGSIPPTGISSVDNIIKYMEHKAYEMDIHFDVTFSLDLNPLIQKEISEADLNTLLADLLENAMIAAKYGDRRHVLLNIHMLEDFYTVNIFDSGIPFSKEVLVDLGLKKHTTHKAEGGSGIGLTTLYGLLQKYGASLSIEEFAPDSGLYTKKISVIFNGLGQYTLITCRDVDEVGYLQRRTDLLILNKTVSAT